jgi:two-component system, NarL family, sensor kinase
VGGGAGARGGGAPPGGAAAGERRDWLAGAAFTVIGGRIAYRRADNPVGWLFLTVGGTAAAAACVGAYSDAADRLAWVSAWLWWPAYGLLPLALMLFPDGRLPGRRWRWAALLAVVGVIAPTLGLALGTLVGSPDFLVSVGAIDAAARPFLRVAAVGMLCTATAAAAGATALGVRWRRATDRDRRQLSWPTAAAFAVLVGWVLESLGVPGMWVLGGAAVPVAAAVAIVRHGLYGLGTLFSRTVTYAILTALLGGLYVIVVVALTRLVAPATDGLVPEALGALTIAVLFQPLRRRVQVQVDRRFNRARYDAARAVERFASRLRQQVELDALMVDLLAVLDQTVQPACRSLWLLPAPAGRAAADGAATGPVPAGESGAP